MGRWVVHQIDLARHQRREPCTVVDNRQIDHFVRVAGEHALLDPPPNRVLDEHRFDVRLARFQHVRAGAVRLMSRDHVLLLRIVLRLGRAVLLAPRLAHDVDGRPVLELDGIGAAGGELDGEIVDLLGNAGGVGVNPQLRRLGTRALKAEYDVVCGEGRAVVKLHSRTKLYAPCRRVDLLPRHCQRGFQVQILVALHQRVIEERIDVVGEVLVL